MAGFWDTLSAAYKLLPDAMGAAAENIARAIGGTEQGIENAGNIAEVGTRPAAQAGSAITGGTSSRVNNGSQTSSSTNEKLPTTPSITPPIAPPIPPRPPTAPSLTSPEPSDNGEITWFNTWGLFTITLVGVLIFAIFFMI